MAAVIAVCAIASVLATTAAVRAPAVIVPE
jgi:hypothetical protein